MRIWEGDFSYDRGDPLLLETNKTSTLTQMRDFNRYSSDSRNLCSFTGDFSLDKRNLLGYSAVHDKIFYS